jgi:hypothetical protein
VLSTGKFGCLLRDVPQLDVTRSELLRDSTGAIDERVRRFGVD